MEQIYITNLEIQKVRHLQDISVPLAENGIKHLILTGKNGSGKTSAIEAVANYLNNMFTDQYFGEIAEFLNNKKEKKKVRSEQEKVKVK